MEFPRVELSKVSVGCFLVVRYMPMSQDKGIVATRITDVYDGGFDYENLVIGVQGSFDEEMIEELTTEGCNELLVGLPDGFRPPLLNDLVYKVGGVYIPKEQERVLPQLSLDRNYQRSLDGLKNPERVMGIAELEEILEK